MNTILNTKMGEYLTEVINPDMLMSDEFTIIYENRYGKFSLKMGRRLDLTIISRVVNL